MLRAAQALWNPALRGQVGGELALLNLFGVKPTAACRRPGRTYLVGSPIRLTPLTRIIHNYPIVFFIVLGVVFFLTAWLILFLLRRFKAGRLSSGEGKK